jgi:hypothetical protein
MNHIILLLPLILLFSEILVQQSNTTMTKTISLTTLNLPLPDYSRNLTTTPAVEKDGVYAIPDQPLIYSEGFYNGYLGVPFKGHHTEQFILGYVNVSQAAKYPVAEPLYMLGSHPSAIRKRLDMHIVKC